MAITSMISYSLYTALLISIVATNGFPVDDVCRQTKDPQLCVAALGGPQSQNSDLSGLGNAGLLTAARGATTSEIRFAKLLASSPRPDLNPKFSQCEAIYKEVSETITSAQQAARFGRWDQVIPNVSPVLGPVDQCEDLFTGTSPLHSMSERVRVAAEAVLIIAKTLSKVGLLFPSMHVKDDD